MPPWENPSAYQKPPGILPIHAGLLLLLFLVALGVRLLFVNPDNEDVKLFRDEQEYVQYAHNLIHHRTFSKDTSPSPGYPLWIALSMAAGGKNGFLSILFYSQAVLSALLAPLTFLTGILLLPLPAALAAALLTAVVSRETWCRAQAA